jgi:hypothetical protein
MRRDDVEVSVELLEALIEQIDNACIHTLVCLTFLSFLSRADDVVAQRE